MAVLSISPTAISGQLVLNSLKSLGKNPNIVPTTCCCTALIVARVPAALRLVPLGVYYPPHLRSDPHHVLR
jgi:hypothetical protein